MVLIDDNGKPKVFQHQASAFKKGKLMDYDTFLEFVKTCIAKEFQDHGYEVLNPSAHDNENCDLTFKNHFGKIVCCKILLTEEPVSKVIAENDFSSFRDYCQKRAALPRLFAVSAFCLSSPEGSKMIHGGEFALKLDSVSLIEDADTPNIQSISEYRLLESFAAAWNERDTSGLNSILSCNVHYSSSFVFDEITGRTETIDYLEDIFKRNKAIDSKSILSLCRNKETGELLLADKTKGGVFSFKYFDSRINDIGLSPLDDNQVEDLAFNEEALNNSIIPPIVENDIKDMSEDYTQLVKDGASEGCSVEKEKAVIIEPDTLPSQETQSIIAPAEDSTDSLAEEVEEQQNSSEPVNDEGQASEVQDTKIVKKDVPSPKKSTKSKTESRLFRFFKQPKTWGRIGVVTIGIVCVAFAIAALVVSLGDYPDYITSFKNKWKYTFNLPNNSLANSLIDDLVAKRPDKDYLIVFPGQGEWVVSSEVFYRNRAMWFREFPSMKAYIATNQISDLSEVHDDDFYIVVPNGDDSYPRKGRQLLLLKKTYENFSQRKIYNTRVFDYKKQRADEIKIIDQVADIPVTSIDLIEKIGWFYEEEDILTKAIDFYRFALKRQRGNSTIRGMLAYSLAISGEVEEARKEAETAIKKNPKEIHALSALAITASNNHNWAETKKYAKKAIDYGCDDSNVYYAYCEALYKLGDIKESQNYYNKAYEADKFNPRRDRYKEYKGAPFEVLAFHYGAIHKSNKDFKFDETIRSSTCTYIYFKLDVMILREEQAKIGVKLYKKGVLALGDGSVDGYTYYDSISESELGQKSIYLKGWGRESGGFWSAGSHKIEIWYNEVLVAEDTFYVY